MKNDRILKITLFVALIGGIPQVIRFVKYLDQKYDERIVNRRKVELWDELQIVIKKDMEFDFSKRDYGGSLSGSIPSGLIMTADGWLMPGPNQYYFPGFVLIEKEKKK